MKKKILSNKRRFIRKNKSKRKGRKNNLSKNQMIQKGGYMVRNLCLLHDKNMAQKIFKQHTNTLLSVGDNSPEKTESRIQFIQKVFNIKADQILSFDIDINNNIYDYINETGFYNLIAEDLMDYVLNYYFSEHYGDINTENLNFKYKNIILNLLEINHFLNIDFNFLGYDTYCPSGLKVMI